MRIFKRKLCATLSCAMLCISVILHEIKLIIHGEYSRYKLNNTLDMMLLNIELKFFPRTRY